MSKDNILFYYHKYFITIYYDAGILIFKQFIYKPWKYVVRPIDTKHLRTNAFYMSRSCNHIIYISEGKGQSFYFEIDKYWHPFIFSLVCVSLIGQRIIWHKTDYRLPAKHFLENYNVECNNRLMVRLVKINLLLDGRFYTISIKTNLLLDIDY